MNTTSIFLSLVLIASAQDWPGHRGIDRDGIYKGQSKPSPSWRVLWKVPVGNGYAGVSIAAGKAFTIEQRNKQEVAAAYDLATGKVLWVNSWDADFNSFLGGDGPRSTPTFDAGVVYCQGAQGELRALDANSGRVIWRHNILQENGGKAAPYGVSISPLIAGNLLITHAGGTANKSIVAYDKTTGKLVWGALNDDPAYASPMIVTIGGARQILTVTASRVVALKPENGALLWDFPWATSYDVNAAQPVLIGNDRLLISSGYGHGAALIEVRNGKATAVWENRLLKNKFSSSVFFNGFIYGLDENILSCIDAATGQRKWKGGRYGYGQVALIASHGQLLVTEESGEVALVKADPTQFQELGKAAILRDKTWNQPALAEGRLVVRNQKEMACVSLLD
ncbi:MAG: PQQ-like beta-propeller repeat protein [Acidobacteria bacterium]|nr:PQQ-like beta-propeller repeat protein [Acidobacteriota bacterium]